MVGALSDSRRHLHSFPFEKASAYGFHIAQKLSWHDGKVTCRG
jgi:hypothetical protein